jgi:transcriptional regulator with XRE-family HTH domain
MPHPPRKLEPSRSAAHWFGAELRHWRGQRGLSQSEVGALVHVSEALIGKIEKAQRRCTPDLAASLDRALNTGGVLARCMALVEAEADNRQSQPDKRNGEDQKHSIRPPRSVTLEKHEVAQPDRSVALSVERRRFLAAGGIAALTAGSLLDLITPVQATSPPDVVRPDDIEQVRTAAATLAGWDNHYGGGGIVREAAMAQLRWSAALLECACPSTLRYDLFSTVGRLGIVVGASAFDAYAHDDARRFFTFATACAEEADDWHLRAKAQSFLARQAVWCGEPDKGLTYAELGLARCDRLTATEQAMLHTARARAFAKMGRIKETLAAVGAADDSFARSNPREDPPWMAYYDEAQHHGDTGHALYDIALRGYGPAEAARRLRTAVEGHTDAYVRSRAISRTKLASLLMATSDPAEAAAVGNRALDEVGRLRSRRAADDMKELHRLAHRHRQTTDVVELRERITAAVPA